MGAENTHVFGKLIFFFFFLWIQWNRKDVVKNNVVGFHHLSYSEEIWLWSDQLSSFLWMETMDDCVPQQVSQQFTFQIYQTNTSNVLFYDKSKSITSNDTKFKKRKWKCSCATITPTLEMDLGRNKTSTTSFTSKAYSWSFIKFIFFPNQTQILFNCIWYNDSNFI